MRFSGGGDVGVLLRHGAAEIVAEVAAHLGVGVVDAVLVVLCGDGGQRVGLVAITLEVALGDLAEDPGETGGDFAFFAAVGCGEEDVADLRAGGGGHFFGADDEGEAAAAGGQEVAGAVDGGGAGGAGVFEAGGLGEAEFGDGLQDEGRRKVLFGEAVVEEGDEDAVDVGGVDAGIVDGGAGDAGDEGFDVGVFELAEGGVGPADDAGFGHVRLLLWRGSEFSGFGAGWHDGVLYYDIVTI